MRITVVIKDVEEEAYRSLKGEAAKLGLKVGEAASQAFKSWVRQRTIQRLRDIDRMRRAARVMDENRAKLTKLREWSGVEEIRKWRELRTPW
ncbi:TPA: hypothetical protein EYP44_05280 [Candidatus Bathyarchaeota archaeon]|nr:hypothetical protein [Candidatus Bathyarchaeota archaeon]